MNVDFLPFLAISTLLIVMPGPDTAVVTKNALLGGRRSGIHCAVGVAIGLTVWTIAAALGHRRAAAGLGRRVPRR